MSVYEPIEIDVNCPDCGNWFKIPKPKRGICKWKLDKFNDCYETDCSRAFVMTDGTPAENDYKFCPNCGQEIEVKK